MGQTLGNLGDPNVTNPNQAKWGDLDSSEKSARLFAGGAQGLSKGLQNFNQQPQQQGSGQQFMPPPMPQQPQVQLPGIWQGNDAGTPGGMPQKRPTLNPFYGGH